MTAGQRYRLPNWWHRITLLRMGEEITLRLDRQTATALRDVLYMHGEHFAAAAPIVQLTREEETKLGTFLRDLDIAFGGPGRFA